MNGSERVAKPACAECDKEIDGEVVWYRPFGSMVQTGPQSFQFIAEARNEPMDGSLPFHPTCFELRTGQEWPPKPK